MAMASRRLFLHEGVMAVVKCSAPTCDFKTADVSEPNAIVLLANHGLTHVRTAPDQPATAPASQRPKLEHPIVDVGMSIKD